MRRILCAGLAAVCLACFSVPATAELTAAAKAELDSARQDAVAALQRGPQDIKLLDQAVLKLPADYGFIPNPQAKRLIRAMGNRVDDSFLGLVVHKQTQHAWLMTVEYQKSGYIKDDDAKHWKIDELLQNIKDGTEAANEDRAAKGIPELEIDGWVQPPQYTEASHELIWSIKGHHKGESAEQGNNINYNTYVLGREGYISMDLLTDPTDVQTDAVDARALLNNLSFDSGKRYQDFDSSTDKVAEYGLAALIGGVALKKLGLFALAAAFFVKIWKLIAVAVFGAVAGFKKYMKNKKAALIPPPPGGNLK